MMVLRTRGLSLRYDIEDKPDAGVDAVMQVSHAIEGSKVLWLRFLP